MHMLFFWYRGKGEKHMIKNSKIRFALVFLFVMIIISFGTVPKSFQNDTFYDIKVGEYITNHGITTIDQFSIHDNLKCFPNHWLLTPVIYFVYKFGGFPGLYLLLLLWTCLIFSLLYITCYKVSSNRILSLIISGATIFALTDFITLRAQVFSYALFILEIFFIESFLKDGKNKWIIMLPILSLIIINIHYGAWPFYFILFLPYFTNMLGITIGRFSCQKNPHLKKLFIPFVIGGGVGLINPFGLQQIGIIVRANLIGTTLGIKEFSSPNFKGPAGLNLFFFAALVFVLFLITKKQIKMHHFFLLFGSIFMSLTSIRHCALFFIIAAIVCSDYIADTIKDCDISQHNIMLKPSRIQVALLCISFSLYAVPNLFQWSYVDGRNYPVEAIKYIKQNENLSTMRIFNQYDFGSYIILNDIKVFIDSRAEPYTTMYSPKVEVIKDYYDCEWIREPHRKIFDKYKLNCALVYRDSSINTVLSSDQGFKKLYEDSNFVFYKKAY